MSSTTIGEKAIKKYLQNSDDFSGIYLLGNKRAILTELKRYVEKHPKSKDKINYIIENLDELLLSELEHDNFMDVLDIESIRETNAHEYLSLAYDLLNGSIEESIKICRKKHILDSDFKKMMKKFTSKFPNQVKEINYMNYVYNEYKEKYNLNEEKSKNNCYVKTFNDHDKKIETILDVYKSGYCVEEYCSNTGKKIWPIKYDLDHMSLDDKNKYNKEYNEIMQRDNSEFYKYMLFVVSKLSEIDKDDLTMLDYHTYTKLTVADFIKLANTIVEDKESIKDLLLRLKIAGNKLVHISKISELNSKTVIAGREVTREEKEMIFNYLEQYDYPTCDYKIALRKYLDGEILNDKKLVIKK